MLLSFVTHPTAGCWLLFKMFAQLAHFKNILVLFNIGELSLQARLRMTLRASLSLLESRVKKCIIEKLF